MTFFSEGIWYCHQEPLRRNLKFKRSAEDEEIPLLGNTLLRTEEDAEIPLLGNTLLGTEEDEEMSLLRTVVSGIPKRINEVCLITTACSLELQRLRNTRVSERSESGVTSFYQKCISFIKLIFPPHFKKSDSYNKQQQNNIDREHDIDLILAILDGLRPDFIDDTPEELVQLIENTLKNDENEPFLSEITFSYIEKIYSRTIYQSRLLSYPISSALALRNLHSNVTGYISRETGLDILKSSLMVM
ncbi:15808_t:CDS:2 [Cetraspora pellucida]|uniref:15808_t:CDS:1 n=1 Tax=Cetraspora pellucida TaxID=1433469 RepID=A0ACA9M0J5_9GLOM|nr:15808_t:CDS:2 [Cetraspora pellucida]